MLSRPQHGQRGATLRCIDWTMNVSWLRTASGQTIQRTDETLLGNL